MRYWVWSSAPQHTLHYISATTLQAITTKEANFKQKQHEHKSLTISLGNMCDELLWEACKDINIKYQSRLTINTLSHGVHSLPPANFTTISTQPSTHKISTCPLQFLYVTIPNFSNPYPSDPVIEMTFGDFSSFIRNRISSATLMDPTNPTNP